MERQSQECVAECRRHGKISTHDSENNLIPIDNYLSALLWIISD